MSGTVVDSTLRALGGRSRYQLLQAVAINLGSLGAAFQLLDNIFIGRKITWHQCAPPASNSQAAAKLPGVNWNSSSEVTYGKCEITVSKDNHISTYPCLFGYEYDYPRDLSFRTEFDLVCDYALLADFLQTLVIVGQGFGAVLASILSDKIGRKRVFVTSQLGLLVIGLCMGVAPSFAWLAFLKFFIGCLQQGVVTGKATMGVELFPSEYRSLASLILSVIWTLCCCFLALTSFLLQHLSWRYQQCFFSAVSLVAFFQMWYIDESLRWLVANGKKEEAVRVVERAARTNHKDIKVVLATLNGSGESSNDSEYHPMLVDNSSDSDMEDAKQNRGLEEERKSSKPAEVGMVAQFSSTHEGAKKIARQQRVQKLTLLDLVRQRNLRANSLLVWVTWFTGAFCMFTSLLMSTSLQGNRFFNFFLTAVSEIPAGLTFYYMADRTGRKPAVQLFFLLSGVGLLCTGFLRVFEDIAIFGTLSVMSSMLGMMGATGLFGAMFFYTPELYPTNIRQQALGCASFAGRCGGMIAPFMVPLSEVIIWAPGAIGGMLCFLVIFLFRFLPETQGRELPQTLEDIEAWHKMDVRTQSTNGARGWLMFTGVMRKIRQCFCSLAVVFH